MALRVARGLFRLWLILSVLWVAGMGVVTWQTFPEIDKLTSICDVPAQEPIEATAPWQRQQFDAATAVIAALTAKRPC
jgi:hypothetical protein